MILVLIGFIREPQILFEIIEIKENRNTALFLFFFFYLNQASLMGQISRPYPIFDVLLTPVHKIYVL